MDDMVVVSEKELAQRLNMSLYSVRKLRYTEGMPFFRTRGRVFYRLQAVLGWMQEQEKVK